MKNFSSVYFYYPGKEVDPKICSIKVNSAQDRLNPYFAHKGFGLIFDLGRKGVVHISFFGFVQIKNFNDCVIQSFEGRPWRKLTWRGLVAKHKHNIF